MILPAVALAQAEWEWRGRRQPLADDGSGPCPGAVIRVLEHGDALPPCDDAWELFEAPDGSPMAIKPCPCHQHNDRPGELQQVRVEVY